MTTRTPQVFDRVTTLRLHLAFILALTPVALVSSLMNGWYVAVVIASTMAVSWGADVVLRLWRRNHEQEDGSALLWGMLLAFLMPVQVPLVLPWLGAIFSVLVIKGLLGGSGSPWLNPVLAGWAFCTAAWPQSLKPLTVLAGVGSAQAQQIVQMVQSGLDKQVTIWLNNNLFSWLSVQLPGGYIDLVLGLNRHAGGVIGETGVLFLLAGTVFLLVKGYIPWQIPTFFFIGFALPMIVWSGSDSLFHVFSGTFLLGMFFLAPETSSRPLTHWGLILFASLAGLMVFFLRLWGTNPDGTAYAILWANFLVPWIDLRFRKKMLNDFR